MGMRHRHETWKEDMEKLHMDFRSATRSVNGLLVRHINDMKRGLFHGKYPPHPEIARVIKEFQLDQDAREKLTDLLQKRERAGNDWQKDLWETEQRLKGAKNPSMMALTMVVCIQQGKDLPPLKPVKKDVAKQYDERHGHNDRDRDRSRGDRRQRYRSRDREWGTSSSGHRDDRRYDDRGDGRNQGHHRDRRDDRRDDSRDRSYKSGGNSGGGGGGGHGEVEVMVKIPHGYSFSISATSYNYV